MNSCFRKSLLEALTFFPWAQNGYLLQAALYSTAPSQGWKRQCPGEENQTRPLESHNTPWGGRLHTKHHLKVVRRSPSEVRKEHGKQWQNLSHWLWGQWGENAISQHAARSTFFTPAHCKYTWVKCSTECKRGDLESISWMSPFQENPCQSRQIWELGRATPL